MYNRIRQYYFFNDDVSRFWFKTYNPINFVISLKVWCGDSLRAEEPRSRRDNCNHYTRGPFRKTKPALPTSLRLYIVHSRKFFA